MATIAVHNAKTGTSQSYVKETPAIDLELQLRYTKDLLCSQLKRNMYNIISMESPIYKQNNVSLGLITDPQEIAKIKNWITAGRIICDEIESMIASTNSINDLPDVRTDTLLPKVTAKFSTL